MAATLYKEHLALSPDDFGAWVQRGHAEKESGNFDEAEICYHTARRLKPDDSDLWLQIGHLYKLMHKLEAAAGAYQKSHSLDPSQKDAADELERLKGALSTPQSKSASDPPLKDEDRSEPDTFKRSEPGRPIVSIGAEQALNNEILSGEAEAAVLGFNFALASTLTRLMVRNDPLNAHLWRRLGTTFEKLGRREDAFACNETAALLQDHQEI